MGLLIPTRVVEQHTHTLVRQVGELSWGSPDRPSVSSVTFNTRLGWEFSQPDNLLPEQWQCVHTHNMPIHTHTHTQTDRRKSVNTQTYTQTHLYVHTHTLKLVSAHSQSSMKVRELHRQPWSSHKHLMSGSGVCVCVCLKVCLSVCEDCCRGLLITHNIKFP